MEVEFKTDDLRRLATDGSFNAGFSREVVRAYLRRLQQINAALDERDIREIRSLNFEKLKGARSHQHSIRLNKQWRLIVEIVQGNPKNTIRIVGIEDYH